MPPAPDIHRVAKHSEHQFARRGVEQTGRLVCGISDRPPTNRPDAIATSLLLAHPRDRRGSGRPVAPISTHPERVASGAHEPCGLQAIKFPRPADVLERRERGQQVEVLDHEAQRRRRIAARWRGFKARDSQRPRRTTSPPSVVSPTEMVRRVDFAGPGRGT